MSMSHSEIAHRWAHRVKNRRGEVYGEGGNMLYDGERIYSYGKHFCMARLLPDNVVVYGTHTYSPSTGKHQSIVRSAVSHRKVVECYDPARSAPRNRDVAVDQIKSALKAQKTKRRVHELTRWESRLSAINIAERFNEYLAALPANERAGVRKITPPKLSAEDRERIRQLREARRIKQEQRDALRREQDAQAAAARAERQKTRIPDWRAHRIGGTLYDVPTMLRLSKDGQNVETSKGADIPVSHAKRLWPVIENVRALKKAYRAFGEEGGRRIKLGHYELESIEENGDIVVGCHNIAYSEIELIAQQLGLLEATV